MNLEVYSAVADLINNTMFWAWISINTNYRHVIYCYPKVFMYYNKGDLSGAAYTYDKLLNLVQRKL